MKGIGIKYEVALLLIALLWQGDMRGQSGVLIEPFSAFSWSVNKSLTGSSVRIENGQRGQQQHQFSLGAGNEFGLFLNRTFDSSDLTLHIGFSALSGKKNRIHSFENTDSGIVQYNVMESFQVCALLGIGYQRDITEKVWFNVDAGLSLPLLSRLREERIFQQNDFSERTTVAYRTNFTPAFWFRGGIAYRISENLSLKTGVYFNFMSLSDKRSEIKQYIASDNQSLTERYPTVSDREAIYHRDILQVKNDPLFSPDTFDPNKPSESIRMQRPFSRMGVSVSVVWRIDFKIEKH